MRNPPLIAVAHGSRDPRAAATVTALLDRVRLAHPELEVRAAYLDHSTPTLTDSLRGLATAVVLPLLLTEAYHSRVDLPATLAEARARDPRPRIHYGATLGPHPLLLDVLERRLAKAGVPVRRQYPSDVRGGGPGAVGLPAGGSSATCLAAGGLSTVGGSIGDPDTAVVLVSAGSSDASANAVIAQMARTWAARAGWWAVVPAYASAVQPSPAQAVASLLAAGAPRVVVAPYLLAPGHFADKVRLSALAAGAELVADVLGPAPELAAILMERYTEARSERLAAIRW